MRTKFFTLPQITSCMNLAGAFILIFCVIFLVDVTLLVRSIKNHGNLRIKLWHLFCMAVDLLPAILIILFFTAVIPVDSQFRVKLVMWVITLYMVINCPRIVYFFLRVLFFRTRFGKTLSLMVAGSLVFVFLNGTFFTRRKPEVRKIEIRSEKIPKSFDGYRIVQLSDMHLAGMMFPHVELSNLLSIMEAQKADAVVFTGDLIVADHNELGSKQINFLKQLKGRDGIFAVQGNHDIGIYSYRPKEQLPYAVDTLLLKQRDMGWTMLLDSTIYLKRGRDSISLSGTAYTYPLYSRKAHYELPSGYSLDSMYKSVPPSLFNITLTHLPMMAPLIIREGYGDLILAGHVHSMQMKLSIFGHCFSPAQWMYRHWSGLYDIDGHQLYVNDGFGNVGFFFRIGVKPEISLIILHSNS